MFVQIIQGQVGDRDAARAAVERWNSELAPGADGWLGTTGGVTDDGKTIALVRFESAEAAKRNSDRPEQGAWWSDFAGLFSGEPEFHESEDVDVELVGDPDTAGFVQVMQGRTTDPQRSRELMREDTTDYRSLRPDILGMISVAHDGNAWTSAIYFTSEAEAREGERKEMPPEAAAMMQEMAALTEGEIAFYDLRSPWLDGPAGQ